MSTTPTPPPYRVLDVSDVFGDLGNEVVDAGPPEVSLEVTIAGHDRTRSLGGDVERRYATPVGM